jgi:hypothetical protein
MIDLFFIPKLYSENLVIEDRTKSIKDYKYYIDD